MWGSTPQDCYPVKVMHLFFKKLMGIFAKVDLSAEAGEIQPCALEDTVCSTDFLSFESVQRY